MNLDKYKVVPPADILQEYEKISVDIISNHKVFYDKI